MKHFLHCVGLGHLTEQDLETVVYVLSSGCRWDELPSELENHITAWRWWKKMER